MNMCKSSWPVYVYLAITSCYFGVKLADLLPARALLNMCRSAGLWLGDHLDLVIPTVVGAACVCACALLLEAEQDVRQLDDALKAFRQRRQ